MVAFKENDQKMKLDAVFEEYKDLRDEIKRRIDQRSQITQLMITFDGTLAGFALYTGNLFILGLVPFVSAFFLHITKASYVIHRRLTRYIREIIEGQKLPNIFKDSDNLWISWETFYMKRISNFERQKGARRPIYDIFQLSVFIVCSFVIFIYSLQKLDIIIAIIISIFYTILAGIVTVLTKMPDPYKIDDIDHNWETLKPIRQK